MVESAILRLHLPEFEKVSELAGFHSRMAATIADLDTAGCTPAQLARVRPETAPFRDAIVAVWQDVELQMRDRDVVTRGEQLRRIAQRFDTVKLPERIWMSGFAQLSGPEIELIQALGERTELTLTAPEGGLPIEGGFEEVRLTGGRAPREELSLPETAERETEEIARRIIELSNAGTPFREMGVVVRQPAKYEELFRAAFERFRIPANFYFAEPLATHSAGRLLGGTVDGLLIGWEHEQTMELLRQAPIAGTSNSLDMMEMAIKSSLPGQGLAVLKTKDRMLSRLLTRLDRLSAWLHEKRTPAEWAERLNTLPSLFWPGHLQDHVAPGTAARYRSQAAGLAAFARAMQTAAEWWPRDAKPIALAEFWRVAKSVVRLSSVNAPNRSRNVVHVISAYEARQWDLSAIFVCGLVEKEFPAQNGRDPFLSDAALRDLARQGVRVRTSADKDEEEFGLFAAVCARARDLAVLSYPRTDARGQATLRSIFLKDRAAGPVPPAARPLLPTPVAPWNQPSQVRSPDLIAALSAKHQTISVSALERLLQCPFQFFGERTLHVKQLPERPEDRLSFLLQGNIVHAVLRDWFADRPPIEPLFREAFDRICAENHVLPGFRTERLRRALLLALKRFEADTSYPRPTRSIMEQDLIFEIDSSLTAKGRFDRIDLLDGDQAVIIDYKFSNSKNTKDKVEDETKLQGPLYSVGIKKALGLDPVAMVYVSLKDANVSYVGWGDVPGLDLQPMTTEWMEDALHRVSTTVSEFRSGAIKPKPAAVKQCQYCTFNDACRIEQPIAVPAAGA
jgi:ATP-dependent helicase/DNAse subunit B